MEEKKCRYCASSIPKAAKICPFCRKTLGWTLPAKIALGIIVILALSSLLSRNDPPPMTAKAPEKAPIAITSEQLYREYDENEIAADQKYSRKALRVSGTIRDIGKTFGDKPFLNLSTGQFSHQVMVSFPARSYDDQLASFKRGEWIELTGTCTGKTLGMVGIRVE